MKFLDKFKYEKFGWYALVSFIIASVLLYIGEPNFVVIGRILHWFTFYFIISWLVFKIPVLKKNQTISRLVGIILLVVLIVPIISMIISIFLSISEL